MEIFVNDQIHIVDTNIFLSSLLPQLGIHQANGFAVAVNNTVIPKKEWNEYILNEKDKIIIIKATQGG